MSKVLTYRAILEETVKLLPQWQPITIRSVANYSHIFSLGSKFVSGYDVLIYCDETIITVSRGAGWPGSPFVNLAEPDSISELTKLIDEQIKTYQRWMRGEHD